MSNNKNTIEPDDEQSPDFIGPRMWDFEHWQVVRQGRDAITSWREAHPRESLRLTRADLKDCDLQEADLRSIDMRRAVACGAMLSGADLRHANLEGADLRNANFTNARLDHANLRHATLNRTDLTEARFTNADLTRADISDAYLRKTELAKACLEYANLYKARLIDAKLINARLQNANLQQSLLKNCDARAANLEGADLFEADLQGSEFSGVQLKDAVLIQANLQNTTFTQSNLEGVRFCYVIVDGGTQFRACTVDKRTDCTGVGLGNVRVEPELRSQLERNVRQFGWERQYEKHRITTIPVRLFLVMSDYGSSSRWIWRTFALLAVIFALVYMVPLPAIRCGYLTWEKPVTNIEEVDGVEVPGILQLYRCVYFSVVTMTTLGFGDVTANPVTICGLGYLLVGLQVILGYILLGALITRFATLFQSVE